MTRVIVLFLVAGVETPNEEVGLLLETHSEVEEGMCTSVVTINTLQLLLSQYVHIMQPVDLQHKSMSITNNMLYAVN